MRTVRSIVKTSLGAMASMLEQKEERIQILDRMRTESAEGAARAARALRLKEEEYESLMKRLQEVQEENAALKAQAKKDQALRQAAADFLAGEADADAIGLAFAEAFDEGPRECHQCGRLGKFPGNVCIQCKKEAVEKNQRSVVAAS